MAAAFAPGDPGPEGTRKVTAYVAGLPISPEALHEMVLDLLPGRTGAAAPAEYVICEAAPPDGASVEDWKTIPGAAYAPGIPGEGEGILH